MKRCVTIIWTTDPQTCPKYARIINSHHFERIAAMIDDAKKRGDTIWFAGSKDLDKEDLFITPHIVLLKDANGKLMADEIFGPVLSVLSFDGGVDEMIRFVKN